jgi:hypothetical protein
MDTEINLNDYKMDKIYFNMLWMNIFAIIVLIFTLLLGGTFYFKIYGLIPRRSAAVKAVEKRSEKL